MNKYERQSRHPADKQTLPEAIADDPRWAKKSGIRSCSIDASGGPRRTGEVVKRVHARAHLSLSGAAQARGQKAEEEDASIIREDVHAK